MINVNASLAWGPAKVTKKTLIKRWVPALFANMPSAATDFFCG